MYNNLCSYVNLLHAWCHFRDYFSWMQLTSYLAMWEEDVPFLNLAYKALVGQLFLQLGYTAITEHDTSDLGGFEVWLTWRWREIMAH